MLDDQFLEYIVDPADHFVYLREVLTSQMQLSHSLLTQLKLQHKIRVNGQITKTNYQLQAGDLVTVDIALDEMNPIEPEDIPLDIVYEDCDFLVINKPPQLAVHPVKAIPSGTLANAVTHYWAEQGKSILFRPINRLDKNTSGLILIGKSQYAHQAAFRQQKQGLIKRNYLAIANGVMPEDSGSICLPIAHMDPRYSARSVDPSGKPAITHFHVLQRYEDCTLLSLSLETGRTHQIRVHLSQLGFPICGDIQYGHASPFIDRQALHAASLSFQSARTGEYIHLKTPLPADMTALLDRISRS